MYVPSSSNRLARRLRPRVPSTKPAKSQDRTTCPSCICSSSRTRSSGCVGGPRSVSASPASGQRAGASFAGPYLTSTSFFPAGPARYPRSQEGARRGCDNGSRGTFARAHAATPRVRADARSLHRRNNGSLPAEEAELRSAGIPSFDLSGLSIVSLRHANLHYQTFVCSPQPTSRRRRVRGFFPPAPLPLSLRGAPMMRSLGLGILSSTKGTFLSAVAPRG